MKSLRGVRTVLLNLLKLFIEQFPDNGLVQRFKRCQNFNSVLRYIIFWQGHQNYQEIK